MLFGLQHRLHACCGCIVQRMLQGGPPLGGGDGTGVQLPEALLVRMPSSRRDWRQNRLLQVTATCLSVMTKDYALA